MTPYREKDQSTGCEVDGKAKVNAEIVETGATW